MPARAGARPSGRSGAAPRNGLRAGLDSLFPELSLVVQGGNPHGHRQQVAGGSRFPDRRPDRTGREPGELLPLLLRGHAHGVTRPRHERGTHAATRAAPRKRRTGAESGRRRAFWAPHGALHPAGDAAGPRTVARGRIQRHGDSRDRVLRRLRRLLQSPCHHPGAATAVLGATRRPMVHAPVPPAVRAHGTRLAHARGADFFRAAAPRARSPDCCCSSRARRSVPCSPPRSTTCGLPPS